MRLSEQERLAVAAAVSAAEAQSDGEIMVIAAEASDRYADVALTWSVLVMLLALAAYAAAPGFYMGLIDRLAGGWRHEWTPRELLTFALIGAAVKFLATHLILAWRPLRLALTPGAVKARRVRRRAIDLFKAGIEQRTATRTGVLLYLSLRERRAEIVADEAIHSKVSPERWGAAMASLVDGLRAGKPGEGLVSAVSQVGNVLTETFPYTGTDPDEVPDRLIEL